MDIMWIAVSGIRDQVGVEVEESVVATKIGQLDHVRVAKEQRVTSSGLAGVPVVVVGDGRDSFSTNSPTLLWS